MAIIYTKSSGEYTINIDDTAYADSYENYTTQDRATYQIFCAGSYGGTWNYSGSTYNYDFSNYIIRESGNSVDTRYNWRHAIYFIEDENGLVLAIYNPNSQNAIMTSNRELFIPVSRDTAAWSTRYSSDMACGVYTNIPIFETELEAQTYCETEDDTARVAYMAEHAVNYVGAEEYEEETKYYYIENKYGLADTVRNTATAVGGTTTRSMRFQANEQPVLYFNDDYSLTLVAPGVVASYSMTAPLSILDNVPETSWQEGSLMYTGLWYGSIERRLRYTTDMLADGRYMYGFALDTNIYVFKDQTSAEDAMENDDYTGAGNYDIVNGGDYPPPIFGTEESTTEFGGGADTSPFMQTYILSRNALIQVAQKWYNTEPETLADILTGLKMFGDKPYESISGITMYPFDVTRILSTISQTYIYFGTYKMEMGQTSLNKAASLVSNAYLDCGSIFLAPLFKSYRDFEPYTQLDLYLPFIGWIRADIGLLIGKTINVRYYVDIHTRACIACILANGVLVANHSGTIGVGLPATSADYQGYANSVAGTLIGSGGGALKSAGTALASAASGNYLGAIANVGAAAVGTASTLYQLEKLGAPADHATTKGNYTAALGCYMPQYVLFRYTIHDPIEPSDFSAMCGRPSGVSKNIGAFSGFLSCKQVKLNTSGMLDAEAAEIEQLLKGGIYL